VLKEYRADRAEQQRGSRVNSTRDRRYVSFRCDPFDNAGGRGYDVSADGDYSPLFTVGDFQTRLARLRAIALTRSPARPVRRQNSRARSIAPRWEK